MCIHFFGGAFIYSHLHVGLLSGLFPSSFMSNFILVLFYLLCTLHIQTYLFFFISLFILIRVLLGWGLEQKYGIIIDEIFSVLFFISSYQNIILSILCLNITRSSLSSEISDCRYPISVWSLLACDFILSSSSPKDYNIIFIGIRPSRTVASNKPSIIRPTVVESWIWKAYKSISCDLLPRV